MLFHVQEFSGCFHGDVFCYIPFSQHSLLKYLKTLGIRNNCKHGASELASMKKYKTHTLNLTHESVLTEHQTSPDLTD